jgi:hypothetical protein
MQVYLFDCFHHHIQQTIGRTKTIGRKLLSYLIVTPTRPHHATHISNGLRRMLPPQIQHARTTLAPLGIPRSPHPLRTASYRSSLWLRSHKNHQRALRVREMKSPTKASRIFTNKSNFLLFGELSTSLSSKRHERTQLNNHEKNSTGRIPHRFYIYYLFLS